MNPHPIDTHTRHTQKRISLHSKDSHPLSYHNKGRRRGWRPELCISMIYFITWWSQQGPPRSNLHYRTGSLLSHLVLRSTELGILYEPRPTTRETRTPTSKHESGVYQGRGTEVGVEYEKFEKLVSFSLMYRAQIV